MKNFSEWSRSRSRLFLPGAGADPSMSEPESAPGPWPPGAGAGTAQKSGGSATLDRGESRIPIGPLGKRQTTDVPKTDTVGYSRRS